MKPKVLFVRTPVAAAPEITTILQNLVLAGWRVVSHTESRDEYSFVLEAQPAVFEGGAA